MKDWPDMKKKREWARRTVNAEGYRICDHCHSRTCHRARPECRWMRKVDPKRRACTCGGGCHHPHRIGGHALCLFHPNHGEAIEAELRKPFRRTA